MRKHDWNSWIGSRKQLSAARRNIRIAHSFPSTPLQIAAARKNVKLATAAAALLPRTRKQLLAARRNAKIASCKPRTEKQIAAVTENLKIATKVAASKPRTEKQLDSSRRTIRFAYRSGIQARKVKNGVCDLCGESCFIYRDHDHETGIRRGNLCGNCNLALGLIKDNPQVLRKMAEYVERYKPIRFPRMIRFPRLS